MEGGVNIVRIIQLVKQKQVKLDEELNALYEKDEESGKIFEQHDHFHQTTINESLQEAFLLAATTYLYSQFEFSLNEIARKTGELFKSEINVEDYKHKCGKFNRGISKFLKYIEVESNINLNDINGDWSKIKQFQKVRNCIVHANGRVKSNYEGLKEYAKATQGVSYDEDFDRITVSKDYLLEMNKVCFEFLNKIMERVWLNRPN